MTGYNVLVVGPESWFWGDYDVRVSIDVYREAECVRPASMQQSVGCFETRKEAVRFMREVFGGLGLRLSN